MDHVLVEAGYFDQAYRCIYQRIVDQGLEIKRESWAGLLLFSVASGSCDFLMQHQWIWRRYLQLEEPKIEEGEPFFQQFELTIIHQGFCFSMLISERS